MLAKQPNSAHLDDDLRQIFSEIIHETAGQNDPMGQRLRSMAERGTDRIVSPQPAGMTPLELARSIVAIMKWSPGEKLKEPLMRTRSKIEVILRQEGLSF